MNQRLLKWALTAYVSYYAYNKVKQAFEDKAAQTRLEKCKEKGWKVCIIGAGMSGICMAIKLKAAGIPFVILEEMDNYGGTWYKNSYPGVACDVPSHWYSYSFAQKGDWSRVWAPGSEILQYFRDLARQYGLEPHTMFKRRVVSAQVVKGALKGGKSGWKVVYENVETGERTEETFLSLISGIGQLDRPKYPNIEGMDKFQGDLFHTAEWRHDVSLKDKRVVGIGTGPSAIQAYPEVAKEASKLTVVQRSPTWIAPKDDYEYSGWAKWVMLNIPLVLNLKRLFMASQNELLWILLFPTRAINTSNKFARHYLTGEMMSQIPKKGKELKSDILPDGPIGCKRLALTSDWLPMLDRDNVDLITTKPREITKDSIVFEDGREVKADVIVIATGFHTTDFLFRIDVRDENGVSIQDKWNGVPHAYNGVAVNGYPNFFLLYGPGTNLGHSSIIFMVETQVRYTVELLKRLVDDEEVTELNINEEAYEADFQKLKDDLSQTVFNEDCESWYKINGQVVNNWSGTTTGYYMKLYNIDYDNFIQSAL